MQHGVNAICNSITERLWWLIPAAAGNAGFIIQSQTGRIGRHKCTFGTLARWVDLLQVLRVAVILSSLNKNN
jgi:hypothetical protein